MRRTSASGSFILWCFLLKPCMSSRIKALLQDCWSCEEKIEGEGGLNSKNERSARTRPRQHSNFKLHVCGKHGLYKDIQLARFFLLIKSFRTRYRTLLNDMPLKSYRIFKFLLHNWAGCDVHACIAGFINKALSSGNVNFVQERVCMQTGSETGFRFHPKPVLFVLSFACESFWSPISFWVKTCLRGLHV